MPWRACLDLLGCPSHRARCTCRSPTRYPRDGSSTQTPNPPRFRHLTREIACSDTLRSPQRAFRGHPGHAWPNALNLCPEMPISLLMRMSVFNTSSPEGVADSDGLIGHPIDRPDRDPVRVYLAGLAPGSRRTMAQALDQIARIASNGQVGAEELPWAALRYEHTRAIRTALRDLISPRTSRPLGPATINKSLCALRGVLREAWRLSLMSAEDYHRATDLEPVRGTTVLRGRALESNEVAALFHVLQRDDSPAAARDAAVLALGFAGGGLRRAELCRGRAAERP